MDQPTLGQGHPEGVRTFLHLTHLLDAIEKGHPDLSAPLRLALLRARRNGQIGNLDQGDFRDAAARAGLSLGDAFGPVQRRGNSSDIELVQYTPNG